jgi:hypothetical protein
MAKGDPSEVRLVFHFLIQFQFGYGISSDRAAPPLPTSPRP